MMVVGSCGSTIGTSVSPPSHPVFSISLNDCEWTFQEKAQASILLQIDPTVSPADYYYDYHHHHHYYYFCNNYFKYEEFSSKHNCWYIPGCAEYTLYCVLRAWRQWLAGQQWLAEQWLTAVIGRSDWPQWQQGLTAVISGTDCGVNGSSSILTRDTWLEVFCAMQGNCTAHFLSCHYWTDWVHYLAHSVKLVNMP